MLILFSSFSKADSVALFIQGSNANASAETDEKLNEVCQHDFRLDEEIGIYCLRCGVVKTAIKDISPPVVSHV